MPISPRAQAVVDRVDGLKSAISAHIANDANHETVSAAAVQADEDAINDAVTTLYEVLGLTAPEAAPLPAAEPAPAQ